jgi:hypothetical protein
MGTLRIAVICVIGLLTSALFVPDTAGAQDPQLARKDACLKQANEVASRGTAECNRVYNAEFGRCIPGRPDNSSCIATASANQAACRKRVTDAFLRADCR